MPKRKKISEDELQGNCSIMESRPKRRRNDTTLVDTIQLMFDPLRNQKKEDDTYLCEAFLRIPKKKADPQYYEVVKSPIDMLKIQQKMKTDLYNSIEEFCSDVELLVENAKIYYAKSTEEYKDACELWKIFLDAKESAPEELNRKMKEQNLEDDDGGKGISKKLGGLPGTPLVKKRGRPPKTPSSNPSLPDTAPMILEEGGTPMTMSEAIEELFGAVITATDDEKRIYSYDFHLLPAPEKYPEYYQVIQQPIDLKTIAHHIQDKHYENLESLERDLQLMFDNACTFNEPGSQIFKDARSLKKLSQMLKYDLLQALNAKKAVRLRSKRPPGNGCWSSLVVSLQEGQILPLPEDEQLDTTVSINPPEEDESDEDVDMDSPYWQLFQAAKNLSAPDDPNYCLMEPFRRLPNRRWHADYYQEIKNPIALCQIRRKIVKNEYTAMSELFDDLNLMLSNAQQFNRPDSRIHRDAKKLQIFIQAKAEAMKAPKVIKPQIIPIVEEPPTILHNRNFRIIEEQDVSSDSDSSSDLYRKGKPSKPWTFKRRAKILFKTLMDFMTDDGRQPIIAFIERPSRKDYPDYYEIINDPIDMEMIETRIKTNHYGSDEQLVEDFRTMFKNCRKYNEEKSHIYHDATILEKVLNDKVKELQCDNGESLLDKNRIQGKKNKYSHYLNMTKSTKLLYNAIRDYKDKDHRQISDVFTRLPLKTVYPDYYEVIKSPMDLETILHKWKSGNYSSLDDIMSDLTLLFHNACTYNEPDSQIYRDALTLQRLALQKRLELSSQDETVPNVQGLVQEMLMSLFISVFNMEDKDGKYISESFSELPEYEDIDGQKVRALSFDVMKRRLDKNLYTRLDNFQQDLFSIFTRARLVSKPESKVYKDSIFLQREFIKVRDELCGNGSILRSRALKFTEKSLIDELAAKVEPIKNEDNNDDTNDGMDDEDSKTSLPSAEGMNMGVRHNDTQYYVGDFVYAKNPDKTCEPMILHIQRLWTNASSQQMLYGCHYYRAGETFHLPTRKFYENELFKTEKHHGILISDVIGKCIILSYLDFPKYKINGYDDKDIYVVECRYSTKNRFFKKIKVWPFTLPKGVNMTERPELIELKRIGSVFKDRIDKHKEELAELEEDTKVMKKNISNIVKISLDSDPKGTSFYHQYNIAFGVIKLGDFVYIKSGGKRAIRHINRIWVTQDGLAYMSGMRYVNCQDVSIASDKTPYKQEVYLSAAQEILPLSEIIGKCAVLEYKDYLKFRPTEIPENDIYLVQSFLDEMTQRICSLQSGIIKFDLPEEAYLDEFYTFWSPLDPDKFEICIPVPKPKIQPKVEKIEPDTEDSQDNVSRSIASTDSSSLPVTPKPIVKRFPTGKQFQQITGKKQLSGYILFSGEIRKSVITQNPSANFGEISRLVGIEWKRLTETERKAFEDRAHQLNLTFAEKAQSQPFNADSPVTPQYSNAKGVVELPMPNNPDIVFECHWESCDFMFEDIHDLYEHLANENGGHVPKVTAVFECSWRGCSRHKKTSLAPFPFLQRLIRHVREVHILKNMGKVVAHHDRSRNFVTSSRRSIVNDKSASPIGGSALSSLQGKDTEYQITFGAPIQMNGQVNGGNEVNSKSMTPMFVTPPPKTQRLLHSEAYIKYIENLDKPYVSNWEKQLSSNMETTMINDSGRLPAHWLSNGAGNHGNIVNALWALREHMMKDSLGISKIS